MDAFLRLSFNWNRFVMVLPFSIIISLRERTILTLRLKMKAFMLQFFILPVSIFYFATPSNDKGWPIIDSIWGNKAPKGGDIPLLHLAQHSKKLLLLLLLLDHVFGCKSFATPSFNESITTAMPLPNWMMATAFILLLLYIPLCQLQ